jgi:hypothetical protein
MKSLRQMTSTPREGLLTLVVTKATACITFSSHHVLGMGVLHKCFSIYINNM